MQVDLIPNRQLIPMLSVVPAPPRAAFDPCALGETSLTSVFHDLHLYLCRRCALDVSSPHLAVHLPRRVPVGDRYSLLDLYFACAMMEMNMEVFFLLLAAKVRSSCEEGPGQSALQSAYHDPHLDVTELKQNRTT